MDHTPKITLYLDVNLEDCTYSTEFCYEIQRELGSICMKIY